MTKEDLDRVAMMDVFHGEGDRSWVLGQFTEGQAAEVLRLARLGLWAGEHGPGLLIWLSDGINHFNNEEDAGQVNHLQDRIETALDALPTIKEEG